jgi:hypothetical protein
MNHMLVTAAILIGLICLAYKVIGEITIFPQIRRDMRASTTRESQLGLLWASSLALRLLGWALAGLLLGIVPACILSILLVLVAMSSRRAAPVAFVVISAFIIFA